jgi:hypothetical protein
MKLNDQPPSESGLDNPSDSKVFADVVDRAMKRAVKQAIAEHHRAGNPVAIWRDGQVVLWYPDGSFRPVDPGGEQ